MLGSAVPPWRGRREASLRTGIEALVTELLGVSPRFAEMWGAHEVEVRRAIVKKVHHPRAGHLEFECQVLRIPDTDQRMILYCATPGSPTQQAFRRLAEEAYAPASEPTNG
jgi:transcription regulator MmyB-like protein